MTGVMNGSNLLGRRCGRLRIVYALLMLTGFSRLAAQDPAETTILPAAESSFQKDETDLAIDRGIAYLVSKQREDGAILDKGHDTTMTALSIMAMASVGIQPADPTSEGQAMQRALAFVLRDDRVDDKGYFGRKDGSRMYGHGIITLMLTEMLGMGTSPEQDQLIHDRGQQAIDRRGKLAPPVGDPFDRVVGEGIADGEVFPKNVVERAFSPGRQ